MNFVFVDETGDPGKQGSKCFGLALLQVHSRCYASIRRLLFSYRLLSGMFPEVEELPQKPIAHLNLLRGISSLVEVGLIKVSGLYLDKERYGGRYLQWVEDGLDIPETDWRYYLRNYLLRHLLEMHFSGEAISNDDIDLVLDRVMFSETQRVNTLSYLNSKTQITQPFAIPPIKHLTVADSEYVGALQLVHIIADLVRNCASGRLTSEQEKLATSFKLVEFVGHKESDV